MRSGQRQQGLNSKGRKGRGFGALQSTDTGVTPSIVALFAICEDEEERKANAGAGPIHSAFPF
jgi:hypothetical protein